MVRYMLLWLEGPLQAWGHDSKFSYRDTLDFPTKSGILGMLLSAMGRGGKQEELLAKLSSLEHRAYSYSKGKVKQSRVMDYHVVGNGYDKNDKWERWMIPRRRDGAIPNTGGSKLTYRYYIQDGIFAVIAGIPADLSYEAESSFRNPVWPVFLGRRTCVPSAPVFRGVYDSVDEAETVMNEIAREEGCVLSFSVLEQNDPEAGDVLILHDVPLCFGPQKRYSSRYVTIIRENDVE